MTAHPRAEEWTTTRAGLLVPAAAAPVRRPVAVDLFAGAGGFSCGLHQAGFRVAAAVEWDPTAAVTYMVNLARPGVRIHFDSPDREAAFAKVLERHLGISGAGRQLRASGPLAGQGWITGQPAEDPGCEHFWVADIRNVRGGEILTALGLAPGEVDAVVGGPPCQGFSKANRNAGPMDPRNSFVFEFARLVLEIQPRTMVMENVPQLLTMTTPEGVPVIDAFCRVLADGGFSTYDALRASLRSNPDARAALTRPAAESAPAGAGEPDPAAPTQQDLFTELGLPAAGAA